MSLLKYENLLRMSATAPLHAVGHNYCVQDPVRGDFFRITPVGRTPTATPKTLSGTAGGPLGWV